MAEGLVDLWTTVAHELGQRQRQKKTAMMLICWREGRQRSTSHQEASS